MGRYGSLGLASYPAFNGARHRIGGSAEALKTGDKPRGSLGSSRNKGSRQIAGGWAAEGSSLVA
jgi:hypothetical protein